jgi:GntR family transcriptional regulator, transcriptional repressor for pyruvate dehydrogenase complex
MSSKPSNVLFRPPHKVTIVASIMDQVVQQIQQGDLKPGDRLPSERQLIEMLGVSRSSVREALQGLTVMGLVETRPGQGTFITSRRVLPNTASPTLSVDLQREMLRQYFETRRAIECPITRLAAIRRTADEAIHLRRLMDIYRRNAADMALEDVFPSPHQDLHLYVAQVSHNPFYISVVQDLMHAVPYALHAQELRTLDDVGAQRVTDDEIALHEAIVAAVCDSDGDAAYKAMDYHLDYEIALVDKVFGVDREIARG